MLLRFERYRARELISDDRIRGCFSRLKDVHDEARGLMGEARGLMDEQQDLWPSLFPPLRDLYNAAVRAETIRVKLDEASHKLRRATRKRRRASYEEDDESEATSCESEATSDVEDDEAEANPLRGQTTHNPKMASGAYYPEQREGGNKEFAAANTGKQKGMRSIRHYSDEKTMVERLPKVDGGCKTSYGGASKWKKCDSDLEEEDMDDLEEEDMDADHLRTSSSTSFYREEHSPTTEEQGIDLQSESFRNGDRLGTNNSTFDQHNQDLQGLLRQVAILVDKAEWLRFKDSRIPDLLVDLSDAVYNAKDFLDLFVYEEIRQKTRKTGTPLSKRVEEHAANTYSDALESFGDLLPEFAGAKDKLNHAAGRLEAVIDLWDSVDKSQYSMLSKRYPCFYVASEQFVGRKHEKDEVVIKLLSQSADRSPPSGSKTSSVSQSHRCKKAGTADLDVLAIVGAAGAGKTTLAKFIYSDQSVQNYFHLLMWINVPHFDARRLTKGVIKCTTGVDQSEPVSLSALQDSVIARRFLLVLDGLCNEDSIELSEWQKFCEPLTFAMEGSKILVTTRSREVAEMIGTVHTTFVTGLPESVYWKFFISCTKISTENSGVNNMRNVITEILKGSPLAAKVVAGVLRSYVGQSGAILENIVNKLQQEKTNQGDNFTGDESIIISVLRLCYLYLPTHLKSCLSFCSIFPKGYEWDKDLLIDMWISGGCVSPLGSQDTEETYTDSFLDLISSSFFQKSLWLPQKFVIHDLIYDVAQSSSRGEIFSIEDIKSEIPKTVHHLSVCMEDLKLSNLIELGNYNGLRSLLILTKLKVNLDQVIDFWFCQLTKIHSLKLSYCNLSVLPESIGNLKFIRFLDVSYTAITSLPETICGLHNLKILGVLDCPLETLPRGFNNLTNLHKCYARSTFFSKISEIGKLTSLQELPLFIVRENPGYMIQELEGLKHLRGSIRVTHLENVKGNEDAVKANLNSKEHIDKLILEWSSSRVASLYWGDFCLDEQVLEGLQPHSNLKMLQIEHYFGSRSPSWLVAHRLPFLSGLCLENCCNLREIPSLPSTLAELKLVNVGLYSLPTLWEEDEEFMDYDITEDDTGSSIKSSMLCKLHIERCQNLSSLEEWLLPYRLPALGSMYVGSCNDLSSLPVERFEGFKHLEKLQVVDCPNLISSDKMSLPSSIKQLVLSECGELDKSLPYCLENLASLTTLSMNKCLHLTSLPWQSFQGYSYLKNLEIVSCPKLTGSEGLTLPSSIKSFVINSCGKFDLLLPGCLGNLTSLTTLEIRNCPLARELPFDILKQLTALRHLTLDNCEELRSVEVPVWLYLKDLSISNCNKLTDQDMSLIEDVDEQKSMPALESVIVDRTSIIKIPCLRKRVHSILSLEIKDSSECCIFTEGPEGGSGWLRRLSSLQELCIRNCANLESLPEELSCLTSLRTVQIHDCPAITSLPEICSLRSLHFSNCNPMLMEQLTDIKSSIKNSD